MHDVEAAPTRVMLSSRVPLLARSVRKLAAVQLSGGSGGKSCVDRLSVLRTTDLKPVAVCTGAWERVDYSESLMNMG